MLAIILEKPTDKMLSLLGYSSFKDFKIYVPAPSELLAKEEDHLNYTVGALADVKEEYVVFLDGGVEPGKKTLGRINTCIKDNPGFDVYHLNVEGGAKFPLKAKAERLFKDVFMKGVDAPIGSFAFKTSTVREKLVKFEDGSLNSLATVMACAGGNGVRTVRWTRAPYSKPHVELTPEQADARTWHRIEFLRWTENFFGDDDYPLTVGKSFALFAGEVAKLYPARSKDELKEIMNGFSTVNGPIRKLRAATALKSALKERTEDISDPSGQPVED